ncbi:MAG: DNA alkylation repair protein [Chloroflexi bacterium]|nr:DNA alkylation repair protein [Chloroflexota bacterium]
MTTDSEVLAQLEALGSEKTRKTYARHGVGANQYGVSYADLGKLKKQIKVDNDLALTLWASGNHDARILALMIADPAKADSATLDAWAGDLSNYVIADAFSTYVGQTSFAKAKAEQWMDADNEWIADAGWSVLGRLAASDQSLPDSYFTTALARIARDLHSSKNRVRHAMNNAVIAIGVRNEALETQAIATATQIGKVVVDHGNTDCKTPAAIPYIAKTKAHRAEKAAKQKA